MTEHPILFKAEMVRAILDDRKTQTRRVIKPQPEDYHGMARHDWLWYGRKEHSAMPFDDYVFSCPYGKPGDRLWVREKHCFDVQLTEDRWHVVYDNPSEMPHWSNYDNDKNPKLNKWRPSIHMPRWASRILLEVTDVRVERVNEISEADCEAEGLKLLQGGIKSEFRVLWDSINEKRGFGWDKNPWCWCVSFKRIKP